MAKLKLGPVNHGTDKNRYCGPSVISAVTSLTTGEAARLIRMQSGKRSVKGTSTMEVKRALKACNIEMHHVPSPGQTRFGRRDGITLAHWLRLTHGTRADRVFLVVAGWHWQLISGNRYVCGRIASLGIVSVKHEQVKRRARVAEVYELTSDHVTRPSIDVGKPKSKSNPIRYQCKKLVKQHPQFDFRIEYENYSGEPDGGFWWVQMSDELEDLASEMEHELSDCHHCYSWDEILERLQEMVAFAKIHYEEVSKEAA